MKRSRAPRVIGAAALAVLLSLASSAWSQDEDVGDEAAAPAPPAGGDDEGDEPDPSPTQNDPSEPEVAEDPPKAVDSDDEVADDKVPAAKAPDSPGDDPGDVGDAGDVADEFGNADDVAVAVGDADGDGDVDFVDPSVGAEDIADVAEINDLINDELAEDDDIETGIVEFDEDGDGEVSAEEAAIQAQYKDAFADIPNEVTDDALDQRTGESILAPSLDPETLRNLTRLARARVIGMLEAKIEKAAATKMAKIARLIFYVSLAGFLLLLMPLFLARKYPGKMGALLKYSGLAAITFFVTVNLFAGAMMLMRGAQTQLGKATNPQLVLANAFFDGIDSGADTYATFGKEIFGPTLESLKNPEAQPLAVLLANGQKVIKDAKVFADMAKNVKKLNVVFGYIPIALMLVTLMLFVLAIRPTLLAIIRLPGIAAAGDGAAGGQVVRAAIQGVKAEFLAALGTIGVLILTAFVTGFLLSRIVGPSVDLVIGYFTVGIIYLQYIPEASSGGIFIMLFGVLFYLVLNVAIYILSTSFSLGKVQKILQMKFADGVPLSRHSRFWKWGTVAYLVAQALPLGIFWLIYVLMDKVVYERLTSIGDVLAWNWNAILMVGPACFVFGFLVLFWAARGLKSLTFLSTYPVKKIRAEAIAERAAG